MSLVRETTEQTWKSEQGNGAYYFTISQDQTGTISVRNVRTPTGLITDSTTGLPQPVIDDINTAIQQMNDLMAQTSAVNGIATFVNQSQVVVNFSTPFSGTTYGVHFDAPDFVIVRATNKATTGFTIETSIDFTGDIRYDVFV